MMRQHGHGKPGGAADLHGVRVRRANAEMLGEHGRQHDMRRYRRVAAQDAVDLGALQPRIGNRKARSVAHEVERGGTRMPAVSRQPDAGDVAHGSWTLFDLSLIHISEPTRRTPISYAVFCLKKKK